MSLIEKLKAGKRNIRRMPFPGTGVEVGLTVLTEAELQEAVFETERHFKKAGIEVSATTLGTYEKELSTRTLFLALVDPDLSPAGGGAGGGRIFSRIEDLKALFTAPAIKDALISEYNALEEECNPNPKTLSDTELMALFETVKKNPDSGTALSSTTQKQLLRFTVSLLSPSLRDSGSTSTS